MKRHGLPVPTSLTALALGLAGLAPLAGRAAAAETPATNSAVSPPAPVRDSKVPAAAARRSGDDAALEAALARSQQRLSPGERQATVEAIIREIAGRDPERAIELALSKLTGPVRDRAVAQIMQLLVIKDPEAASRLIPTLPPGDVQTYNAVIVARALADRSIEQALAWIRSLPVELTQWIVLNNVLSQWAQKDLLAAARYVAEMTPGGALDFAAGHMGMLMAGKPRDAIRWAETLPKSARDAAFVGIASAWAQREPGEAVRWAASLEEEPLRTNALGGAFTYWQFVDQAAARAWLERADLAPETKAKIRYRER